MNNTLKRLLSVVMVLAMVMSFAVMPVSAEDNTDTPAHDHVWSNGVCAVEGCGTTCSHTYEAGICTVCTMADPNYVPPCTHANTTETVVDATCTAEGSKTLICTDCQTTVSTEPIGKVAHTYDETTGICTAEGCGAEEPADENENNEPEEEEDEGEEPEFVACSLSEDCALANGHENPCALGCGCPIEGGVHVEGCTLGLYQEPSEPAGNLSTNQINMNDENDVHITAEISNLQATESVEVKLLSGNEVIATTTLQKTEYLSYSALGVKISITGTDDSWATGWATGMPRADVVPTTMELWVDGTKVSVANFVLVKTNGESAIDWADVPGVTAVPSGTVTPGYVTLVGTNATSSTSVWGELVSNATQTLVVELYAGETKIGQASLKDVSSTTNTWISWSIPFAGSTDESWTVEWAEGHPNKDTQPTKVVLVADGTAVDEDDVKMDCPDNLNPVNWADLDYFKKPAADITYGGYVGTSGTVGTNSYRENIQVDLYNVHAKESLAVELWSGETKLSTTTYRSADRDDATNIFARPINAESITANIVFYGRLAGSWDTEWHVAPNPAIVPDMIKVLADGDVVNTWNSGFTNDTEKNEYITLTQPSADIDSGIYVDTLATTGNRERIWFELSNVYARESLVINLLSDDTLLASSSLRKTDADDGTAITWPAVGGKTVNMVLYGKTSGSWDTTVTDALTAENVPTKVQVVVDGVETDCVTTISEAELEEYKSLNVLKEPAGDITYGIYSVGNSEDRENILIDAYDIHAKNSLVFKLYDTNGALLVTSTMKDYDDDDTAKANPYYPKNGSTTANIVVSGKPSGSWINEWAQTPSEYNIPAKIELYADGKLVDTFEPAMSEEIKAQYLELDGVKKAAADITYGAYVGDTETRENLKVDLYNVYAWESLQVKLYSGETLLATSTLKNADDDNPTVPYYPAVGSYTANIVVSGKPSGSWNTVWNVDPTVDTVPTKIEAWVDGKLVDTFDEGMMNAEQIANYKNLDGVWKAATVTANNTVTHYGTVASALTSAASTGGVVDVKTSENLGTTPYTMDEATTINLNGNQLTGTITGEKALTVNGEMDVAMTNGGTAVLSSGSSVFTPNATSELYDTISIDSITWYMEKTEKANTVTVIDNYFMFVNESIPDVNRDNLPDYEVYYESHDITHIKGSTASKVMTCNGFFANFVKVEIKPATAADTAYTLLANKATAVAGCGVAPGSTVLTMSSSYLNTLEVGKYNVKFTYADGGFAVGNLEVTSPTYSYVADTTNPKTGDSIFMAFAVMLFTGCALVVIPFTLKKKTH